MKKFGSGLLGILMTMSLVSLVLAVSGCSSGSHDPTSVVGPDAAGFDDYDSSARSAFTTTVGSFNGVTAYSNGTVGNVSNNYNTYNGYRTGMKWQCVEYVSRYFKAKFNKQIAGGNANTYYSNASAKGLNRAPNGGTDKPRVGNILCSNGGSYGHVAIVREVGSNYVKVIHQNWSNTSSDNSKTLSMTVSGGKYTVAGFSSSYPVQGWLWPK